MVHGMFNNIYKIVKLVLCGCCQLYVTLKDLPTICLIILLARDHALYRSGRASSISCNFVAVWRSCFVQIVPEACLAMLLLSGDHALCRSCLQYAL